MSLVLGVDGGNSKAIALVARPDGSIVGAARRAGSADVYAGEDEALALLDAVVADALADAGAAHTDIFTSTFSLAGADWPEDIAFLRASLARLGLASPPTVVNDAIGALAGAVPDGPAVVVSLGTGAATGARGVDGSTWHSSFWQVTHGAVELAQAALDGVIRSDLGIRPAPVLVERLLAETGHGSVEEAVHRLTGRDGARATDAGPMVRALLDAAAAGDEVAREVVDRHGRQIGEVAAAAARRVGIDGARYDVAFCGGLGRANPSRLIEAALLAMRRAGQAPSLVPPRWEPAVGALLIGMAPSSASRWPAISARLDATMPPPTLFEGSAGRIGGVQHGR